MITVLIKTNLSFTTPCASSSELSFVEPGPMKEFP
jgi:hypothetical protein